MKCILFFEELVTINISPQSFVTTINIVILTKILFYDVFFPHRSLFYDAEKGFCMA